MPPPKPRQSQSLTFQLFVLLHLVAPKPRAVLPSEKTYITSSPSSRATAPRPLPCWYDRWLAERRISEEKLKPSEAYPTPDAGAIEPAEVRVSVVIPAYNEAERILEPLQEVVEYLDKQFGRPGSAKTNTSQGKKRHARTASGPGASGYEILVVNDGSKDKTVDVVLQFAQENELHDILRVVTLQKNRGKGGGVTHGLRHVRGEYALFADADGASRFSDLGKLIEGCEEVVDGSDRGVAIGSRAHLVGSEAVVKVRSLCHSLIHSTTLTFLALCPAKLPHAILPPRPHHPHTPSNVSHPRHPMRLQALLARLPPPHRALHAHRRLDLRH